jgi:PhnB protein
MASRKPEPASRKAPASRKPAPKKKAAAPKRRKVSAIPAGCHSANAYLIVANASDAIAFYVKAFGARQTARIDMPDGRVMHAEIQIGDSRLMLAEENPQWGTKSPLTLGGSPMQVMLYVKDVDAFVARAVAAGATVAMPIADQFWGDRYGKVADPFGHVWSVATHIKDVPKKSLQKLADEAMRQMAEHGQDRRVTDRRGDRDRRTRE